MNLRDETGTLFRQARPDTTPKDAALDIDAVMRDGYRARRRGFAVIGGAASAGVAAVAAVLALSLGVTAPVGEPDREIPAAEPFDFDPAHAGYPGPLYQGTLDDPRRELDPAAKAAFGDLAVEGGFLEAGALDYERPSDEAIAAVMEEQDIDYDEALSELHYQDLALQFTPWNSPGNGGQVYLRGYVARDGDEEAERSAFTITAMLPGGWTAEPGPTGDHAFPQHLISDEASWTDGAPQFTEEELDDGRTLFIADHGCALEAAVLYPNGSALRSSWDLDCDGQDRELSVEDLREGMLAMPQVEYDTSELRPIGELLDFPPGWAWDEEWEGAAAADARASFEAAVGVLDAAHPGIGAQSADANQGSFGEQLARRTYAGYYVMPFSDVSGHPVHLSVNYYLPGGWLPGLPPEGSSAELYLLDCGGPGDGKDDVCETTEVDGRTVTTRSFGIGEHQSYWTVVYDPAGWAVEVSTSFEGPIEGYDLDHVVELAASLPAPVYDQAEYERD
jgi:hypothetical protein